MSGIETVSVYRKRGHIFIIRNSPSKVPPTHTHTQKCQICGITEINLENAM